MHKVKRYINLDLVLFRFQIESFHRFYSRLPADTKEEYKLILIGGCRNSEDESRVANLRDQAKRLEIDDAVEFCLNVPFSTLKDKLAQSTIGIHTMWNEHFGIGKVNRLDNTR